MPILSAVTNVSPKVQPKPRMFKVLASVSGRSPKVGPVPFGDTDYHIPLKKRGVYGGSIRHMTHTRVQVDFTKYADCGSLLAETRRTLGKWCGRPGTGGGCVWFPED